jgi:hypothetical protein
MLGMIPECSIGGVVKVSGTHFNTLTSVNRPMIKRSAHTTPPMVSSLPASEPAETGTPTATSLRYILFASKMPLAFLGFELMTCE